MSSHDPIRQSKYLRQTLSQDKKPVGFFISAGCPLAVNMPDGKWPLIPDVAGLTKYIGEELQKETNLRDKKSKSISDIYNTLIQEIEKTDKSNPNIEDILSFVRGLKQISKGANNVRGLSEEELIDIEAEICKKISLKLRVDLPDNKTPYHKLAKWIHNIERDTPVEIFTTNYDLLLEEAFEQIGVPYFDGFVGSRKPFFDLRAVEDGLTPKHWSRLWKIHGSINWYLNGKEVYRSTSLDEDDSYIIHPSHLKYDQSRKMPYLALIDRLNKFLRQNSAVLIMSGYSFSDEHLNDTILSALKANPTAMVIGLLFGPLSTNIEEECSDGSKAIKAVVRYEQALKLSENRSNLSIWAYDEAVIGGLRAKWVPTKIGYEQDENIGNAVRRFIEKIKDAEGKETDDEIIRYEFRLGDFSILGDFLQELIGKDQFKIEEHGE
ncbi:MAG: SIR2 family protein [Bacteroidetes bacterium]|nr:MAG: SIR2 family protein [Bacteroidota bacterium]